MKKFLFAAFLLVAVSVMLSAQDGMTEVSNALKTGNAKTLASYFHSSLDLTIQKTEGTYSKSQAEQMIQNFFTSYKPVNYKTNHNGSSSDGSKYVIGRLDTQNGSFRVYLLFKNIGGKELIQTLRFEVSE
jgi:hypothetical protein